MKNLRALGGSTIDYFDDIVASKVNPTRTILAGLRPRVTSRYANYGILFSVNQLESLRRSTYSSRDRHALLSCYTNGTKALGHIKDEIIKAQEKPLQGTCQLCGKNNRSTFDHYLPQESFPEFSALVLNLMPCCFDCNINKGILWTNRGKRRVLNLYTDMLPNVQHLFCDVEVKWGVTTARFKLLRPPGATTALYELIEEHYEKLDLISRYNDDGEKIISHTAHAVKSFWFKLNVGLVRRFLLKQVSLNKPVFGVNHWQTVLEESLANSDDFLKENL